MQTISIAIATGRPRKPFVNVTIPPKEIIGRFAIHRPYLNGALSSCGWVVTHIATGLRVSNGIVTSLLKARRIARALNALEGWDLITGPRPATPEARAFLVLARETMQRACRARPA